MVASGQIVAHAAEIFGGIGDDDFEDAQFVQKARGPAKQNGMHELVPMSILTRRFAAEKPRIKRSYGGRRGQMAAGPAQGAASALERRGQIADGASGDFNALTGAADFAFRAQGHGVVQRYGKNSVGVFPLAHDAVEETLLLRWQERAPIVGYGAAAGRSFALFIPKQEWRTRRTLYQRAQVAAFFLGIGMH